MYILGTLERPTAGSVRLLGEDAFARSDAELARYRNQKIGFIFQDHHLLPQCNVVENVLIPALAGGGAGAAESRRATELLERVGLKNRISHRPGQLSGGERQRVAVCRALINQPVLLLADEPTGNLDRTNAEAVGDLLLEMNRLQQTVLICVTHSAELAARFPRARNSSTAAWSNMRGASDEGRRAREISARGTCHRLGPRPSPLIRSPRFASFCGTCVITGARTWP